jgi:hypothetical protein
MIQIISNLVATLLVGSVSIAIIYSIWMRDIDLYKTLIKPFTSIIETKDHNSIQLSERNIMLSRYLDPAKGMLTLLFYKSITFVNRTNKSVTIKSVNLRFGNNIDTKEVESFYVATGEVKTRLGPLAAIIINKTGGNTLGRVVLRRWKNIKAEIGEEKSVMPGGVWSGSAAFILGITSLDEFKKITKFELVVADYDDNETVQSVLLQDIWTTEASTSFFDDRNFTTDESGNITYLK